MKLDFQKRDFLAIGAVLLLAAFVFVLFLPKDSQAPAHAEIYLGGNLIKTVSLWEDQELTIEGTYTNILSVRDGKIAVTHSTCPGEDCVHCGWLDSAGRSIVCLPNGLEIRVVSAGDVDIIVG